MTTVGVLISAHTPRVHNWMLQRCLDSVWKQERLPDAVAIAIDHNGDGAAVTKQRALQMLNTDLVACVDSDDLLYPNHLRLLEQAILENGVDISYANWTGNNPFPEWFFTEPFDHDNPRHATTTIMYRREAIDAVGGYRSDSNPNAVYADDDWLTFLAMVEKGFRVHHVIETTWHYSTDGGNTSGLARNWKS